MTDTFSRFNSSRPRETVDHTNDVQNLLTSMVQIQLHQGAIHEPMERFDSYQGHVEVVHIASERNLFNRGQNEREYEMQDKQGFDSC